MTRIPTLALLLVVPAAGCGGEGDPATPSVSLPTPPPSETQAPPAPTGPAPAQPLPRRPFGFGDVLDAPEITIEGPEVGDAVFGWPREGVPDALQVPLPRGCRLVKRTSNVIGMICDGNYGAVFGFYTRLTEPYAAPEIRRRFGGRFDDHGRIGVYRPDPRYTLTIDIAHGDHAPVGIRTGGAPLRIRNEPAGDPPRTDPDRQTSADPQERLLMAFGAYDCPGMGEVVVQTRSITFEPGERESECHPLRLANAGNNGVDAVCGEITGRSDLLGARASTYRGRGVSIRAVGDEVEIDGVRCRPAVARPPTKRRGR